MYIKKYALNFREVFSDDNNNKNPSNTDKHLVKFEIFLLQL